MKFRIAIIFFGFIFPTSFAFADTSSKAANVSLDDFEKICRETMNNGNPSFVPSAKTQYCQAAASDREAAQTQGLLWQVWAGVGVVCTAACIASLTGNPTEYPLCTGASVLGGIAEVTQTKNFASALTGIASGVGIMTVNQMVNANVPEGGKKKDVGSCISAASALYQAYSKHASMENSEKSAKTNLANALSPESNSLSLYSSSTPTKALTTPSVNTDSGNSKNPGIAPASVQPQNNPCSNASQSGNTGLIVQCAVAGDSNLPRFVGDSQFPEEFKKASGLDLSNFVSKGSNPGQAYTGAMAGSLTPEQTKLLAAAVKDFQQQLPRDIPSSKYSSGGGGGGQGGGSDSGDLALGDMMSNIMGQFMPKGEDGQVSKGMAAVVFANHRSPATVAEDKGLSIFDRVSYRYSFARRRILEGDPK